MNSSRTATDFVDRSNDAVRHRVVIVGCGFGGLFATELCRRADVDVTLIDRNNHHLFQPLLYQLATEFSAEGDIAPPIRDILRHQRNAKVLLGEVKQIDVQHRRLTVDTLGLYSDVPYDSLILATGASQSYFGHPEFARHAPGMKTIDNALELRSRIFGAFEMAERESDATLRKAWLTFVVVGAGPTGVELAGQIAELARRSLQHNFRRIDPSPPVWYSSMPHRRFFQRFRKLCSGGPRERSKAWAWRSASARWSRASINVVSTPTRPTRDSEARSSHEDLGSRRRSLPARTNRRTRGGRGGRPCRTRASATRLHAARTPRGLRDRRPDELRRPAGTSAGRHPIRPPRRLHDCAPP